MNLREVGLLADLGIPSFLAICMIVAGFQTPKRRHGIDQAKYERQLKTKGILRWCGFILLGLMALRFVIETQRP